MSPAPTVCCAHVGGGVGGVGGVGAGGGVGAAGVGTGAGPGPTLSQPSVFALKSHPQSQLQPVPSLNTDFAFAEIPQ